jgi:hypothetical protein
MAKLSRVSNQPGLLLFECPGCGNHHGVWTDPANPNPKTNAGWSWNGDLDRPTFTPSILVNGVAPITDDQAQRILAGEVIEPVPTACHSHVVDGQISYLGDCTHALAGQTVPLPDIE